MSGDDYTFSPREVSPLEKHCKLTTLVPSSFPSYSKHQTIHSPPFSSSPPPLPSHTVDMNFRTSRLKNKQKGHVHILSYANINPKGSRKQWRAKYDLIQIFARLTSAEISSLDILENGVSAQVTAGSSLSSSLLQDFSEPLISPCKLWLPVGKGSLVHVALQTLVSHIKMCLGPGMFPYPRDKKPTQSV